MSPCARDCDVFSLIHPPTASEVDAIQSLVSSEGISVTTAASTSFTVSAAWQVHIKIFAE